MVEKTVEIGDTEVQIEETDDGFAVTESNPIIGSVSKFEKEVAAEGDDLSYGAIRSIEDHEGDRVKVRVQDETHDAMTATSVDAFEAGWCPTTIEFDYGFVIYEDRSE